MAHPIIDRPHTVSSYDLQLGEVRSIINRMAELSCSLLTEALDVLHDADHAAAQRIIEDDRKIDELERALERLTLMMIMARAPMAGDLRYLIAAIRIGKMLERTGDQAKRIARRIDTLRVVQLLAGIPLAREMERFASEMVTHAIISFNEASLEGARAVVQADKQLNAMNRALIDACCEAMDQGSMSSRDGVEVIAIGKQLERVGDYAANIAGDVVYMLTGE